MTTVANIVKFKRSSDSGKVPLTTDLQFGELALNTTDGKLFFKKNKNNVDSIVTIQSLPSGATSGQTIINDGSGNLSWGPGIPSIATHGGSYLVTDGTTVSWSSIPAHNVLTNGSYTLSLGNTGDVTAPGDILVNSLSVKDNITKTLFLYQDGNLTVKTGTTRWYACAPLTMTGIVTRLSTAGDADVNIRVLKNGSIIYSITVASGTLKTTTSANFNMTTDDYLTINVTGTGSVYSPGAGLSVQFTYYFI